MTSILPEAGPSLGASRAAALRPYSQRCKLCGTENDAAPVAICENCLGPLEPLYPASRRLPDRATIAARPQSLWRYREWLPFEGEPVASLDTGFTPLIDAPRLADKLGVARVWVKNDAVSHPTLSFKDRVVSTAINAALAFGLDTVGCASTGNLANAVAAHAARAGMRHYVFIPSDLESGKVAASAVYGPNLISVDGSYDDVNRLASEIAGEQPDWAFVNVNVRPYYAEGSKTLAFEVAEQLGWRLPEQVVVPVASGSQLTKIDKGFGELGRLGLVEPTPYRVFGAQAEGCSPVATAYEQGHDVVRPVRPDTIAKSLAIGNPADGPYVLDVARRTGGAVASVTDEEVREGIRLLARTEGIFAETAGGVTVATLKKLVGSGRLDPDAETVVFNTGDGLKTLDAIADRVGPSATIAPTYDAFEQALAEGSA
jgi:threonine synthase